MPLSERVEKLEQEVYLSIPCVITSREGDEKEMPELSTKEECVKVCTNRSTSKCHWNGKKFQDHEPTACLVFDSTGKKIVKDKTKTLQQCRNKCDRYHLVKNNKQRLCQFGAYVFHESTWGEFIEDRLESHNVTVENRLESLDEATKEHLALVTSAKEAIEEATPKIERLWNDKAVRDNYNLLMDHRLAQDKNDEKTFCEKDADRGVAVFPAIEVEGEPDELFCVDKNREIMIQSFCEFVPKLDELFERKQFDERWGGKNVLAKNLLQRTEILRAARMRRWFGEHPARGNSPICNVARWENDPGKRVLRNQGNFESERGASQWDGRTFDFFEGIVEGRGRYEGAQRSGGQAENLLQS